jgi:hypothetical protein
VKVATVGQYKEAILGGLSLLGIEETSWLQPEEHAGSQISPNFEIAFSGDKTTATFKAGIMIVGARCPLFELRGPIPLILQLAARVEVKIRNVNWSTFT